MPTPSNAPAHSTEAEQTVLGALLVDPDRMADVVQVIDASHFYDPVHKQVFVAMERQYESGEAFDFVTIGEDMSGCEKLNRIGGSSFLANLAANVPTAAHAVQYAKIVKDKSQRRQLEKLAGVIDELSKDQNRPADELVEVAEQAITKLSVASGEDRVFSLEEMLLKRSDHYAALREADDPTAIYGIRTGFGELDQYITGLEPGMVMVIAARPGMGKTALANDIALHASQQDNKIVAFFSLEMRKEEMTDRIVSKMLNVESAKLNQGRLKSEEYEQLGHAYESVTEHSQIFVCLNGET